MKKKEPTLNELIVELQDRIVSLEIELESWKQRMWDKQEHCDYLLKKIRNLIKENNLLTKQ